MTIGITFTFKYIDNNDTDKWGVCKNHCDFLDSSDEDGNDGDDDGDGGGSDDDGGGIEISLSVVSIMSRTLFARASTDSESSCTLVVSTGGNTGERIGSYHGLSNTTI